MATPPYIELHARSAFSFLRGASQPQDLIAQAASVGLTGLALCDRMGVYGTPRFRSAAEANGLRAIVGAELVLPDGSALPVLVQSRTGYHNLCRCLTRSQLRAAKGEAVVQWEELPEFAEGLVALTGDSDGPLVRALATGGDSAPEEVIHRLVSAFGEQNIFAEVQRHHRHGEERWNRPIVALAEAHHLLLLATNGVQQATPGGRQVVDVFTCLRHHTHLDVAGDLLTVNAERHLKSPAQMQALFRDLPEAISNTVRLAERLTFELTDLGYEFPKFPVGHGETMEGVLRDWTWRGARNRYGSDIPAKVDVLLKKELALIEKLSFAGYFLIVADLVRYARENNILAQGRGSAANSAVCFCLGITAVDPVKFDVLFERFLSEGRKGWPDIDIDLPSGDRREQVIQEVYRRYGPHGAAMTGALHTYRGRGAAREVGKVLNLPSDVLDRFSALYANGDFPHTLEPGAQMEQAGLPVRHPRAAAFGSLIGQILGLPRHLGQHSGGMIICQGDLHRFVPLENAAMPGRVVAQWDKDDCADLGIIKVDLLGLGMMAALQEAVTLTQQRGCPVDLANLPKDDPATFELLQRADTIGLFQVESRAQMATLPRLQPKCFYDLVIEVAIVRPGPIQGDLAHPYLRRHNQEEDIDYFGDESRLKPVLERTLGVPLFQEQMLEMAMVMGGLSGGEAEDLRKAMSFHRSDEKMSRATAKLRSAMEARGVAPHTIERIGKAVSSFALYGFPESHAISFALLAYASAYLKVHRAPEFYCALLNNQPMGFYSPATLIRDAKSHGVQVRPVCAGRSRWECLIEDDGSLRLGFMQVQGLHRESAARILAEREQHSFSSLSDFLTRTSLQQEERRSLAAIGALNIFGQHRRSALWEAEQPLRQGELFSDDEVLQTAQPLRPMNAHERLEADYQAMRLSTGPHPMALIRDRLPDVWRARDLNSARDGQAVRIAGQVICRQRPGTAKGVCFVSLEDETGVSNAIVSPALFEARRLVLTSEQFLVIEGVLQNRHKTVHVRAHRIDWLDCRSLPTAPSHDFG